MRRRANYLPPSIGFWVEMFTLTLCCVPLPCTKNASYGCAYLKMLELGALGLSFPGKNCSTCMVLTWLSNHDSPSSVAQTCRSEDVHWLSLQFSLLWPCAFKPMSYSNMSLLCFFGYLLVLFTEEDSIQKLFCRWRKRPEGSIDSTV